MRRVLAVVTLAGCGRIAFDPTLDAARDGTSDRDADGVADDADNCPDVANPEQWNEDGDPYGDACDPCPPTPDAVPAADLDGDGISDACDPRPTMAGDRIALFDGFHVAPPQAQIDGTWTFDGAAHVTSSLNQESAVTWVVPLQTTTWVYADTTADQYFGNSVARPVGVVTQYAHGTPDQGTMCVFGINPSNSQVLAIADNATTAALSATAATATAGTNAVLTFHEAGTSYLCGGTNAASSIMATATLVSSPNRIGLFARSTSAHFGWAMIITSP